MNPALDLLPEWEDRLRLRRVIFEDGLSFSNIDKSSPEFTEASQLLAMAGKEARPDAPGYFIVCVKGRSGSVTGALDGHALAGNIVVINRSCVKDDRKRELHILLCAAALTGRRPACVVFSTAFHELSEDMAGMLILLGRGFGMSALPPGDPRSLLLLRRVGKELDPLSNGQEVAGILRAVAAFVDSTLYSAAAFERKGTVALIPLPTSPDTREHLHELRDFVSLAGLPPDHIDSVMEKLRVDYVLARKDISPAALF
jgi:hypothetical protein